jgi:L-amino acid N-acyltransferase YncA
VKARDIRGGAAVRIEARSAPPLDEAAVVDLWRDAALTPPPATALGPWWVARDGTGRPVGVAGSEVYGASALLRSVAVAAGERGRGAGRRLVATALDALAAAGVAEAYLVTEGARAFFAAWGFVAVERTTLPTAIAATEQLTGACPQSATVMRLALRPPATRVRRATAGDAAAIARIYNEGIEDRVATFETEQPTAAERARWLRARAARYAVLVAEGRDGALGWLSLNPFSPRAAYRHVADVSVYVARAARGHGVGGRLLAAGIAQARAEGFHKLVLTLFPDNAPARALYLGHGFRPVGILREQGILDGVWRDTEIMERLLDGDGAP